MEHIRKVSPKTYSILGAGNTYGKFLPEAVTKEYGVPRDLPIADSCGFVMVNFGFQGTAKELGITNTNHWYIPTENVSAYIMIRNALVSSTQLIGVLA